KAQEVLASMYYFGIFVKKDYKRAFELFLIAAEDGKLYAQEKLGDMYYEGEYVKRNYKKALEWYHKAMEQGSLYGKIASIEIEQMDIKGEL
ncbi:MAG: sel1 repeat family protein, partial [Elusimicrobia bacterium]|nr:sel1 repeat family protein [Elusimicrobiota bacterium]